MKTRRITPPPKRFEEATSPEYDEIRWKRWFPRLLKRKWQLDLLKLSARAWDEGKTQEQAALMYGIDPRELRDYVAFKGNLGNPVSPNDQDVLNDAYRHYCEDKAQLNLKAYITSSAKQLGANPRHVIELWEINPWFYPIGFERNK
jgi:hypothetical protein